MSYYMEEHPNLNLAQFGWLRVRIWESGTHLSGVIGVHTSEAITDFEGVDNNAENNAAFLVRRTNHGSYTTSADADSIVPLVHPKWAAWADITNNAHAMSVSGCLQAARWLEMTPGRRRAVVVNMAIAAARMVQTAVADGYLAAPTPARRITAQQAIDGSAPGFYGHGETNPGTRYDPGAHFDWALFLNTYAEAIGGGINYSGTITPLEDDMAADTEFISKDGKKVTLQDLLNSIDTKAEDARNEATNAKVLAREARDVAQVAANEATNAKVAGREAVAALALLATGAGADKATVKGIVDEIAERLGN